MKAWVYLTFVAIVAGGVVAAKHQFGVNRPAYQDSVETPAEARLQQHAAIDNAETLIKMRLRDPRGVTFVNEKLLHVGRQDVVCGFVNAKNGFDGMEAHEDFAVVGATVMFGSDGDDARGRIKKLCGA